MWGSGWSMCSGILQTPVLTSCVTLDKSPHLSELPSPSLQNNIADGVKCLLLNRHSTHAESPTGPATVHAYSFIGMFLLPPTSCHFL